MDSEFRKRFLQIPFGLLSGISTSITSATYLTILIALTYFKVPGLESLTKIVLGYICILFIDGYIFHSFVYGKVNAISALSNKKRSLTPSTNPNTYIAYLTCFVDAIPELILLNYCIKMNVSPITAFSFLIGAKIIGALFIGWISDIIYQKNTLILSNLIGLMSILTLEYFSIFEISLSNTLILKLLVMKGLFGCSFVVAKSTIALSSKIEGVTVYENK